MPPARAGGSGLVLAALTLPGLAQADPALGPDGAGPPQIDPTWLEALLEWVETLLSDAFTALEGATIGNDG